VKHDCKSFRAALEDELLGRPSQEKLAWLSWHAHLLSCGECRELLEKEEALEALLASLPEPKLPEELTQRVLTRLREDRTVEVRLDNLLDLDRRLAQGEEEGTRAPDGLAAGILARLAPERAAQAASLADSRLDRLLYLDLQLEVPAGLAGRVLQGLAVARRAPAAPLPARARVPHRPRRAWVYAAAAGLFLVLLGRVLWMRGPSERRVQPPIEADFVEHGEPAPDPQMLAALDVLEQWDLLMQDDVDVLLSTLGPGDEALLDYR
jgi:hypothetical protein